MAIRLSAAELREVPFSGRTCERGLLGNGPSGHSHAGANMALDARRQTLEEFIAAFTTYRPLPGIKVLKCSCGGCTNEKEKEKERQQLRSQANWARVRVLSQGFRGFRV